MPLSADSKQTLHFIGGVYGVGKSTRSSTWAESLGALHATASQLIKHSPLPGDRAGKAVADVERNQQSLVATVRAIDCGGQPIILDGHYCISEAASGFVAIPVEFFRDLAPTSLVLVECDSEVVAARLRTRDKHQRSSHEILKEMLLERAHAKSISKILGVPLIIAGSDTSDRDVVRFLQVPRSEGSR